MTNDKDEGADPHEILIASPNAEVTTFENVAASAAVQLDDSTQMRYRLDDLSVLETLKRYKFITVVAMAASFSASLDSHREYSLQNFPFSLDAEARCVQTTF
jgi:hypothetical protein